MTCTFKWKLASKEFCSKSELRASLATSGTSRHYLSSPLSMAHIANIVDDWIGALNIELEMDLEAWSSDCLTANEELTIILAALNSIQVKSTEAESREKWVAKLLNRVRSNFVRKMEEASEYNRAKSDRIRTKLQACQVKTAQDKGAWRASSVQPSA